MAAPIYQVSPIMGTNLLMVVFAVIVIGGMGSIPGAILAGFGLGAIEGLTKAFYPQGSLCRPAAFCGVFAFKPSTGFTSQDGVMPFSKSFDTVGSYGLRLRWAVDAAMVMLNLPEGRCRQGNEHFNQPIRMDGLRVGVVQDMYFQQTSPSVNFELRRAAQLLRNNGCRMRSLTLGLNFEHLRVSHRKVMQYEAFQAHRGLLREPEKLGVHWQTLLREGSQLEKSDYIAQLELLQAARSSINHAMRDLDVVLVPPTFDTAPRGIGSTGDAGLIIPWTYGGNPLTVLPTALSSEALPIAVMLAGHPEGDLDHAKISLSIQHLFELNDLGID